MITALRERAYLPFGAAFGLCRSQAVLPAVVALLLDNGTRFISFVLPEGKRGFNGRNSNCPVNRVGFIADVCG